jgi:hypothetical protein
VARHIFQACPVWIYTQSNITQAIFNAIAVDRFQGNSRPEIRGLNFEASYIHTYMYICMYV